MTRQITTANPHHKYLGVGQGGMIVVEPITAEIQGLFISDLVTCVGLYFTDGTKHALIHFDQFVTPKDVTDQIQVFNFKEITQIIILSNHKLLEKFPAAYRHYQLSLAKAQEVTKTLASDPKIIKEHTVETEADLTGRALIDLDSHVQNISKSEFRKSSKISPTVLEYRQAKRNLSYLFQPPNGQTLDLQFSTIEATSPRLFGISNRDLRNLIRKFENAELDAQTLKDINSRTNNQAHHYLSREINIISGIERNHQIITVPFSNNSEARLQLLAKHSEIGDRFLKLQQKIDVNDNTKLQIKAPIELLNKNDREKLGIDIVKVKKLNSSEQQILKKLIDGITFSQPSYQSDKMLLTFPIEEKSKSRGIIQNIITKSDAQIEEMLHELTGRFIEPNNEKPLIETNAKIARSR